MGIGNTCLRARMIWPCIILPMYRRKTHWKHFCLPLSEHTPRPQPGRPLSILCLFPAKSCAIDRCFFNSQSTGLLQREEEYQKKILQTLFNQFLLAPKQSIQELLLVTMSVPSPICPSPLRMQSLTPMPQRLLRPVRPRTVFSAAPAGRVAFVFLPRASCRRRLACLCVCSQSCTVQTNHQVADGRWITRRASRRPSPAAAAARRGA